MRYYPETDSDKKEVERLNAEAWMIKALKKNPDYNGWGNHEDYMIKDSGWDSRQYIDSADELWEMDDLNELVNFYFNICRESEECSSCGQSGYNPETTQIGEDWYDFEGTGRRWCNSITQDEVDALWESNRLKSEFKEKPTADQVNEWSKNVRGIGHDAINRHICVKQRAERLGVYGLCEECNGEGYVYTEPAAKLQLQMWFLHPRKGCSRGVLLKEVKQHEMETVIKYLKEARQRNWDRFSKL